MIKAFLYFVYHYLLRRYYKSNGDLFFIGWYGETKLSGMIKDASVSGFRIRKKNIQIGGNRILDSFFGLNTNQRFNRYFVGEIYVFDENLIPNARRDDFEKNETYITFKKEVEETTLKLARLPHKYTAGRANDKNLYEIPKEIKEIKDELSSKGVTETRKGQLVERVDNLRKKARGIKPNAYNTLNLHQLSQTNDDATTESESPNPKVEEAQQAKTKIIRQLNSLENNVASSKNYATDRLPSELPRTCRKQIGIILDVIDRVAEVGLAEELREEIIKALQPQRKTKGKR